MANITLDSIRAAADAKFAGTNIDLGEGETVHLLSAIRLPKKKRDKVAEITASLSDEGVDHVEVFEEVLRLVAVTPKEGEALVEALGGDLALLIATFDAYSEATQLGEASASES